jgi:hypothetical protein
MAACTEFSSEMSAPTEGRYRVLVGHLGGCLFCGNPVDVQDRDRPYFVGQSVGGGAADAAG